MQNKERALLVTIKLRSQEEDWRLPDSAVELEELAVASGIEVLDNISCLCEKPTPNLFIGKGKAEELAALSQEQEAEAVIFSHDLSGTQQRNLEGLLGRKTIDHTQLILDIFALRAKSPEGKMQVELAQLQYLLPRLVGKGVILSRLGGGIGTRGPGEQKLETDRRRIRKKIDKLQQDLEALSRRRKILRKRRMENALPSAALVGYTSAGKSTLLNALTNAGQAVSGRLFTTLDPLYKTLRLPGGEKMILSDTVGFLHNLPHHLIEAFKATLEEVSDADLLIHVLDAAHPLVYEQAKAVFTVLKQLGAENKPMITALNKTDLLADAFSLENLKRDFPGAIAISAKFQTNLPALLEVVGKNFQPRMAEFTAIIPLRRMDLVDLFHREGKVEQIEYLQKGIKIKLNLPVILRDKLLHNKEIKIL